MNRPCVRSASVLLALILGLTCTCLAGNAKVERIGPVTVASAPDAPRQAVEDKGYRVTLDDGWTAEFWFVKDLKTAKNEAPGALYPELSPGEFVALVNFPKGISDYRGQQIPAGIYTLRYQTLPQDGNHIGVAPNPDFLLVIPVANDSSPEQNYAYKKLVTLSAKSTGTNHPAVIALESAGEPGTVATNEQGAVVFNAVLLSAAGSSEKLGIVVKGAAAQ